MRLKEVLRECSDRGYPISAQGLYEAGKRYGFITNEGGTRENPNIRTLDKEKFEEWLKGALEEIPEGYVPLSKAAEMFKVGLTRLYNAIKLSELEYKRIGSGKGIYYVNTERTKEYLATHKTRSYVWRKADEEQ